MADIRVLNTAELQEAAKLSDLVFRDEEQKSMGTAFPYIFDAEAPESIGAYDDGRLAAFMGIVPAILSVGSAKLKVYSIGSVCTHPEARGKGYASQLLDKAISHMKTAGASLMLVSGDRSLYLRAGCRTFGETRRYTLQQPTDILPILNREKNPASAFRFRRAEAKDYLALAALYDQEEAHYDLSLYDLSRLVQAEPLASCYKLTHQVWLAERDNGEAVAFTVIGVPGIHADSTPKVIEAAGDPSAAVALCLEAMSRSGLNALDFPVSIHRTVLLQELDRAGFPYETRANEGTVKILDPARLWQQLLPELAARHAGAGRITAVVGAAGAAVSGAAVPGVTASDAGAAASGEAAAGAGAAPSESKSAAAAESAAAKPAFSASVSSADAAYDSASAASTESTPSAPDSAVPASLSEPSVTLLLDGIPKAELTIDQFHALVFGEITRPEQIVLPEEIQELVEGVFPVAFPFTAGLYYI